MISVSFLGDQCDLTRSGIHRADGSVDSHSDVEIRVSHVVHQLEKCSRVVVGPMAVCP